MYFALSFSLSVLFNWLSVSVERLTSVRFVVLLYGWTEANTRWIAAAAAAATTATAVAATTRVQTKYNNNHYTKAHINNLCLYLSSYLLLIHPFKLLHECVLSSTFFFWLANKSQFSFSSSKIKWKISIEKESSSSEQILFTVYPFCYLFCACVRVCECVCIYRFANRISYLLKTILLRSFVLLLLSFFAHSWIAISVKCCDDIKEKIKVIVKVKLILMTKIRCGRVIIKSMW